MVKCPKCEKGPEEMDSVCVLPCRHYIACLECMFETVNSEDAFTCPDCGVRVIRYDKESGISAYLARLQNTLKSAQPAERQALIDQANERIPSFLQDPQLASQVPPELKDISQLSVVPCDPAPIPQQWNCMGCDCPNAASEYRCAKCARVSLENYMALFQPEAAALTAKVEELFADKPEEKSLPKPPPAVKVEEVAVSIRPEPQQEEQKSEVRNGNTASNRPNGPGADVAIASNGKTQIAGSASRPNSAPLSSKPPVQRNAKSCCNLF